MAARDARGQRQPLALHERRVGRDPVRLGDLVPIAAVAPGGRGDALQGLTALDAIWPAGTSLPERVHVFETEVPVGRASYAVIIGRRIERWRKPSGAFADRLRFALHHDVGAG